MNAIAIECRQPHRGAPNNISQFAPSFLKGRLRGFQKDMEICLKGIKSKERAGNTHAYFPALMTCCGMLEYLAGLYAGRIEGLSYKQVIPYSEKYLPQPDYDPETIRVLFTAFRNTVNHRGIASGVWVDQHPNKPGRRLTWKVKANAVRPAIVVVEEDGELIFDSPWPCKHTHRVHIHLGRLWRDIRDSVDGYISELRESKDLQENFDKCMKKLYPA